MHFKIVGRIKDVEVIATGAAIRERKRLWKWYGKARWRKLKGVAAIEFSDGTICQAEDSLVRSSWDRREGTQDQADYRVTRKEAKRASSFA
jgi:hypothetical protein